MDPQQIAQELADAHELLSRASMARLAYNGPDGRPRVVPIGIFWTGEEIVMSTAATAPKVKALSVRPEIALTIDAGDSPGSARTLSVRGVAHLTIVDGVVPEYLAAARKNSTPSTRPSSSGTAGPCTTRWRGSPSSRSGRATTTSAPAAFRGSSPNSPRSRADRTPRQAAVPSEARRRGPSRAGQRRNGPQTPGTDVPLSATQYTTGDTDAYHADPRSPRRGLATRSRLLGLVREEEGLPALSGRSRQRSAGARAQVAMVASPAMPKR